MVRLLLNGCNGKMGRVISQCVAGRDDCKIVAGADIVTERVFGYPVYAAIGEITEEADAVIDFSHPSALKNVLDHAKEHGLSAVIATTGLDEAQKAMINKAAEVIPVFFSFNMSIGVNLMAELAKKTAGLLQHDFDIEIVEAHHNQKTDARSGTALMRADAVSQGLSQPYHYEYDRHSQRKKRDKTEIGIHSIRGGTIVGEHEVIFAGRDEIITITHSARSKEIFAVGAVNAALFVAGKGPGLYSMGDLVKEGGE